MTPLATANLTRRRVLGGAGALGLVGGLGSLAGCSDTPVTGEGSDEGRRLRASVEGDPNLPRILGISPGNASISRSVFDPLVERMPDGSYEPVLATEWKWDDAGTTLTLMLRDDVTYHSGKAFTANDVARVLDLARQPESGAQVGRLLTTTQSITAPEDHVVVITLDEPFPGVMDALAAIPMVDADTFDALTEGETVNGTGPFTWGSWTSGRDIVLERNDAYWGEAPKLPGLDLSIITDAQAVLAALQSGDSDLATKIVSRDAATLAEDSRFTVPEFAGQDCYVGINTTVAPLDDVRVRRAIAMALDRPRIAQQVFSTYATPSSVPWSADTPGITPAHIDHFSYDVDAARALVEEAGAMGAPIKIAARANNPAFVAIADIVHFGLGEIGLEPTVEKYDAPQYAERMQGGQFEGLWIGVVGLTLLGQVTSLLTANPFVKQNNTSRVTDPAYDALVDDVVAAADDEAKAKASAALTEYMLDQAFHLTVVHEQLLVASVAELSGIEMDQATGLRFGGAGFTA